MQTLEIFATENPVRHRMIAESIKQLADAKQDITVATVAAILPADFDLDPANDPVRQMMAEAQRDGAGLPPPREEGGEPVKDDVSPFKSPDPATREAMAAQLIAAQQRAADLRGVVQHRETARANARARFADELQMWLHGRPRMTAEDNARAYIAASVQDRKERHVPGHPISGPSNLDRELARYGGGSTGADAFAKKQMQAGHRRGAYPPSMRGAQLPRREG